jgi:signal transduction histidine kinase
MSAVGRYVERIREAPPLLADVALAVAILGLDVVEVTVFPDSGAPHPTPLGILIFAVPCLGLVVRRRYVWVTFALLQGWAWIGLFGHYPPVGFLSLTILASVVVYAVADRAPGWAAALAAMAFVSDVWLGDWVIGGQPALQSVLKDAIYFTPVYVLPALAGWSQQRRRKLTAQLEVRAEVVRQEQERLAERAVASERIQIADELRALVSQGVERMTGQAQTARRHLQPRSAETTDRIASIEATGRRTLVEMRRLLLVLRRSEPHVADRTSADPVESQDEAEDTDEPDVHGDLPRMLARLPVGLRRPWVVDWSLVLMLAGFMAGEWTVYGREPNYIPIERGWLPKVLASVILSALLIRRRVPFSVLCLISVSVFLWIFYQGDIPGATEESLLFAVYTVAAYKRPRWAVAAIAVAVFSWSPLQVRHGCFCLVHIGTFAIIAVSAGVAMRGGRRLNRELQKVTDLLLRTRGERARLAVAEERTRVAREMHDLVAHSVTAMVVQAGAARMVAETDPGLAKEHLEQIAEAGVGAMRELGFLNASLDPASTTLEPDRSGDDSDVRVLVDRFRRTGQHVQLVEERDLPPVDEGLRISVYRIVQEALTNVQKHARGAPTTVSIRYQPGGIEIEVTNPAPSTLEATAAVPGAGQGLIGIHERASVFGGTAEAGPTLDGGFRVYVRLPVELVPA